MKVIQFYSNEEPSFKGYSYFRDNFVKVKTFLQEILCVKHQEVRFLQNASHLAILSLFVSKVSDVALWPIV